MMSELKHKVINSTPSKKLLGLNKIKYVVPDDETNPTEEAGNPDQHDCDIEMVNGTITGLNLPTVSISTGF